MKNIWLKFTSFLILTLNFFVAHFAKAGINDALTTAANVANSASVNGTGYNTSVSFDAMISNIITMVLSLIGVVFVIFLIYGGFLWMTASGNETKTDKSKQIIKESIIGLVVVFGAYAISYFVIKILGPQLSAQ
jgi:uncharacterized membrane protein